MNRNEKSDNMLSILHTVFEERIPFNKVLGIKVESLDIERARLKFRMKEKLVGNFVRGTLHGGVISAVLDVAGGLVAFLGVLKRMDGQSDEKKLVSRIVEIAAERDAALILIGLPLNMDGSEGSRASLARNFGARLAAASGLPVEFADERLTSVQAERILAGRSRAARRKRADVVAAQLFLQCYLDRTGRAPLFLSRSLFRSRPGRCG